MAVARVLPALSGPAVLCLVFVMARLSPPVDAQSFLEIADSVRDRDRVVLRPTPQAVPEFIHIAEMANKNNKSPRPPGSVPEFVLIGESVHNSGGGYHHRPSSPIDQNPTGVVEVNPEPVTSPPPVSTFVPDYSNWGDSTSPANEFEVVTEPMPEEETPNPGEEESEEFEEDKIYFEEWDKDTEYDR